jgi:hypothetical protein
MKIFPLLSLILSLLLISCESRPEKKIEENLAREYYSDGIIKSETQVKDTIAHGLMKNYDRDGTLISVYSFNMGRLEGPAVSYYPNGKIKLKMFYTLGKRSGTTRWYYDTGELYRDIPFVDGKISGTKISYYKNGKIMAEAPFLNDCPGLGLKEFNSKGELDKVDTEIKIKVENRLFADNTYTLIISLSNPKPGVNYYFEELIDGKFLSPNQWQLPEIDGVARYVIHLEKGRFRMETLTISASYKTSRSNYRVISRKYNLAIDNK